MAPAKKLYLVAVTWWLLDYYWDDAAWLADDLAKLSKKCLAGGAGGYDYCSGRSGEFDDLRWLFAAAILISLGGWCSLFAWEDDGAAAGR